MARADRSGPIGLRLALAFVAVALCAVALVGLLSAVFAAAEVSHLALKQRSLLTQSLEVAAADAWQQGRGWSMEDLKPVQDLASKIAVEVQVTDKAGKVVASSPGFARNTGPLSQGPIVSQGRQIGTIHLRFGLVGLGSPHHRLRATLWQALASAAGITALLALIVALLVSRRISKPVERLIEVTRARGHGFREARVGQIRAPAELRELASTFDAMADTMARQEQLRRNLVADVAHELRTRSRCCSWPWSRLTWPRSRPPQRTARNHGSTPRTSRWTRSWPRAGPGRWQEVASGHHQPAQQRREVHSGGR